MIDSIQALRAFAAIYVVFYHAAIKLDSVSWISNAGKSGVDLFFIISGFVITLTIANKPQIVVKDFVLKRLIRIVPLYWALTFLFSAILFLMPSVFQSYSFDIIHTVKSLLFVPQSIKPVVYTGWTLVFEMYFYLMFAVFLLLFGKRAPLVCCIFLLLSFFTGLTTPLPDNPFIQLITSSLLIEFGVGCALCVAYVKGVRIESSIVILLLTIGGLLFWLMNGQQRVLSYGLPWALIFFAIVFSKRPLLKNKTFSFLGDCSYSIYLVHVFTLPFIHLIVNRVMAISSEYILVSLFLYTVVGVASGVVCYLILEKPMTRLTQKLLLGR